MQKRISLRTSSILKGRLITTTDKVIPQNIRKRSFLLAITAMLSLFLASCGGFPQEGQQPPTAPSPPSAPGTGNANNSASSSSDAGQTDTQIVQAVSNYVANNYNDQSINVDNSNTTIKYNSDNSTAVATVNYKPANGQPTQVNVLLKQDANGNYQPTNTINNNQVNQILKDDQTTSGTQNTTTPTQSSNNNQSTNSGHSCTPKQGNVLYEADWSSGMNGWTGSSDWKHVGNMVVSDGSPGHPTKEQRFLAPCQPPTQDYAIEAEIQLVNPQCGASYKDFGLVARETDQGGILGGIDCDEGKLAIIQNGGTFSFYPNTIGSGSFATGTGWHTYRLEVQSNHIRLLADGTPIVEKDDNRILSGSKVGMFSVGAQINVRSFKIVKVQ